MCGMCACSYLCVCVCLMCVCMRECRSTHVCMRTSSSHSNDTVITFCATASSSISNKLSTRKKDLHFLQTSLYATIVVSMDFIHLCISYERGEYIRKYVWLTTRQNEETGTSDEKEELSTLPTPIPSPLLLPPPSHPHRHPHSYPHPHLHPHSHPHPHPLYLVYVNVCLPFYSDTITSI